MIPRRRFVGKSLNSICVTLKMFGCKCTKPAFLRCVFPCDPSGAPQGTIRSGANCIQSLGLTNPAAPNSYRFAMQSANQKLLASFEFSHPPDNSERLNVGGEYSFHKYVFLRGGYNLNYDAEGIAGGAGFHFPVSVAGMADLDYAFTDMKDLGGVHRFSLTFTF